MELNVLTYNLFTPILGSHYQQERLDLFVEEVSKMNVEILLLQEIFIFSFLGFKTYGYENYLEDKLKPYFPYIIHSSPIFLFQNPGLFVASKYPIKKIDEIFFNDHERLEYFTTKGALLFNITKEDNVLSFVNTHLHCQNDLPKYSLIRRNQLRDIHRMVEKNLINEFLLGGDLNIDSKNPDEINDYYFIQSLFNNTMIDVFNKEIIFPTTSSPNSRIDYLLYFGNNYYLTGKVIDLSSDTLMISDHFGIIGHLSLN
jgi:endonuclease/exonuclease/phosphatase family metal-dependent hydrolase